MSAAIAFMVIAVVAIVVSFGVGYAVKKYVLDPQATPPQAPVATVPTVTTEAPVTTTEKGKTKKGKKTKSTPAPASSSLPLNATVAIFKGGSCKQKKSVLSAREDAQAGTDSNEVGLWCKINNNNSLWKITQVAEDKKYVYIRNTGTGQLLSCVRGLAYVTLKPLTNDPSARQGQQWEAKKSDQGFFFVNRMYQMTNSWAYLDAKGCDSSGWDGNSIFLWKVGSANQKWYVQKATTSSDSSRFASNSC